MVDIAAYPDAVEQMMGRKQEDPAEPLRDLIRSYARIQIHLCDKGTLREQARILSALATQLELLAGRHDLTQTQALYYAYREIQSSNARMLDSSKFSGHTKSRSQSKN